MFNPTHHTCAENSGEDSGFIDVEQLRTEMTCGAEMLTWPEKYRPDTALIDSFIQQLPSADQSARFQYGFGFMNVAGFNECAWILTWRDAWEAKDTASQEQATYYLLNYVPYPEKVAPQYGKIYDQAVVDEILDIARKAALDDPSGVQGLLAGGSCTHIPWPAS